MSVSPLQTQPLKTDRAGGALATPAAGVFYRLQPILAIRGHGEAERAPERQAGPLERFLRTKGAASKQVSKINNK